MGALALPGEPPLALISTCCGASTFAYDFTKVLMEAAGVPLIQTEKELNKKQPMRTALESLNLTADISVPEGLAALYQESRRRSKYLLFVGEARNDRWLSYLQPEFTASLAQLRARTVLLYRNPLDLFLCRVNDCFEHSGVAEPVFRNGTRSRLCFARRKAREPQLVRILDFAKAQRRMPADPSGCARTHWCHRPPIMPFLSPTTAYTHPGRGAAPSRRVQDAHRRSSAHPLRSASPSTKACRPASGLNEYLLAHGLGEDHAIPTFAVEELAAFEYEETAGALTDLAINQWRLMLNAFGVALRPQVPHPHRQPPSSGGQRPSHCRPSRYGRQFRRRCSEWSRGWDRG